MQFFEINFRMNQMSFYADLFHKSIQILNLFSHNEAVGALYLSLLNDFEQYDIQNQLNNEMILKCINETFEVKLSLFLNLFHLLIF